MNLAGYAEEYLVEVINEYPMALEAKTAFNELPKHKRDALEAAGTLEERAAQRADVTSQIEIEQNDEESGESGSDDDYYTDDSTTVDDSDDE